MAINWMRLDYTSANRGCYGVPYLKGLQAEDLRFVILWLGGRLAPDGAGLDKLYEMAGYLYERRRYEFLRITPAPVFDSEYAWATHPRTPPVGRQFARAAEKARAAFAKLAVAEPSSSSAMGTAWAILDKEGDMSARDLMSRLYKVKKTSSLNSVRCYLSQWRRKNRAMAQKETA